MLTKYIGTRFRLLIRNKGLAAIDPFQLDKLETAYEELQSKKTNSMLKKYLTRKMFNKIKQLKTSFGSTLLDCIQSGLIHHDSKIGVYAADAEAYTVFADLFNPIIRECHGELRKSEDKDGSKWGNIKSLIDLDPGKQFILFTKIQCSRSIVHYPFHPVISESMYKVIQHDISNALTSMTGDVSGQFYPIAGLTEVTQRKLIEKQILFHAKDPFLHSANAYRFWPCGRGIFYNEKITFLVWCNAVDHLSIISMQNDGDIARVYKRFIEGIENLECFFKFNYDDYLGYLTFCPTNLGTCSLVSVHIKLPKLALKYNMLVTMLKKYNMVIQRARQERGHGIIYEICNIRRLGLSEFDSLMEIQKCISGILELEQSI